jgi:molybdopterin-guanine dinucleotide biosynthesis protein A
VHAGIVLCGGRSSRMGRAKAWLPWQGRPLVCHVVARLREVVDEVVVVSSQALELPPLEARVVRDREPELGPLAGIREGLAHLRAELAYVTATDAPWLTAAFVRALLERGRAAAPEVDGFVQTLAAVYPRSALDCASRLLAAGRRRPLDLLESQRFLRVGAGELPDADPGAWRGFNTPDEYLAAVRAAGDPEPVVLELLGRARLAAGRREIEPPVGRLGEVLSAAPKGLGLVEDGRVARPYLVSLDGRSFVRDTSVPVGPGEHVIVLDASVGG